MEIEVGILSTPVPDAVRDAVSLAYSALCGPTWRATVAVRSSTTTLDTATHVLAHTNASFLCVNGADAVLEAVRGCWASLFDERALLGRANLAGGSSDVDVAVLVQRQVDATRAGLVLTRDRHAPTPASQLVVEACFGLGETAAMGLVVPDRYLVERETSRVLAREIHPKDVVVEAAPTQDGTRQRPVDREQARRPALLDSEIRRLANLGGEVELMLHAPQTVEWAIDRERRPWILQVSELALDVAHPWWPADARAGEAGR